MLSGGSSIGCSNFFWRTRLWPCCLWVREGTKSHATCFIGSDLIASAAYRRTLSCLCDWSGQRSSIWRGRRVQNLELARWLVDRRQGLALLFVILNLPKFIHGLFLALASQHAPSCSEPPHSCFFCTRLAEDAPRRSTVGKLCGTQTALQSCQSTAASPWHTHVAATHHRRIPAPNTITATTTLSLKSSTDRIIRGLRWTNPYPWR